MTMRVPGQPSGGGKLAKPHLGGTTKLSCGDSYEKGEWTMDHQRNSIIQGVYRITHLSSGKVYIGSSRNVSARWSSHRSAMAIGIHANRGLQDAWKSDGAEGLSFELLEDVESAADLEGVERRVIAKVASDRLLNRIPANRPSPISRGESRAMAVGEAAKIIGVSTQTVRRLIWDGDLPAFRIGSKGHYRVKQEDVDALIESQRALPRVRQRSAGEAT